GRSGCVEEVATLDEERSPLPDGIVYRLAEGLAQPLAPLGAPLRSEAWEIRREMAVAGDHDADAPRSHDVHMPFLSLSGESDAIQKASRQCNRLQERASTSRSKCRKFVSCDGGLSFGGS